VWTLIRESGPNPPLKVAPSVSTART